MEGGELDKSEERSRDTDKGKGLWGVWRRGFGVRWGCRSSNDSVQFFAKDWHKSDHIKERLPSETKGVAIGKAGKVRWRYSCYKRHGEPWDVEEGGDTGHIRHRTGKVVCSSRESLGLPYSGKRLKYLKMLGWVIKSQATTTEQLHICVSQQ